MTVPDGAIAARYVELGARRTRVLLWSAAIGVLLTVVWSYTFVDSVIGDNVARALLGYDAKERAITDSLMGVTFALVSGVAGTFTACNVAAFGAMGPLLEAQDDRRSMLARMVRPAGWLVLGSCVVAGTYGAIGAVLGDALPQLSDDVVGNGMPVRLLQSVVVFGVIGAVLVYLGLGALRIVPDPLARLSARHPNARLFVMGALIGAFLIGRPFPLFFKLFQYAASTNDPIVGAATFMLQSIGNIVIVVLLFWGLSALFARRLGRVAELRRKVELFGAAALVAAGTFTFLYWVVRVPSIFGYGWWLKMPWD